MKILFTFEFPALCVRATDYINLLLHYGHSVDVYLYGSIDATYHDLMTTHIHHVNFRMLIDFPEMKNYNCWYYDLTSQTRWKYASVFQDELVSFSGGFLACINYEDGYSFYSDRVTNYIKDKTCIFINNALYTDKNKYTAHVRNKVFLTTSYISNSQSFKNGTIPFDKKIRRVMFSGSLTGNPTILSKYNDLERYIRFTFCKKIYDSYDINSIIRLTGYDPTYKHVYDSEIPEYMKKPHSSHVEFIKEMFESYISLSLKGNSYPTNRFFESQAAGCLTLSTKINGEVEIYGVGENLKNYVEIDVSGNDLLDTIRYYLNNPHIAKPIADAGRENWEKYSMLNDSGIFSKETEIYHIESIKKLTGHDIRSI